MKDPITKYQFEPDLESQEFVDLIEDLQSGCRVFEPDPDLRDDYEIGEKELRDGAQEIFLKIQKYL